MCGEHIQVSASASNLVLFEVVPVITIISYHNPSLRKHALAICTFELKMFAPNALLFITEQRKLLEAVWVPSTLSSTYVQFPVCAASGKTALEANVSRKMKTHLAGLDVQETSLRDRFLSRSSLFHSKFSNSSLFLCSFRNKVENMQNCSASKEFMLSFSETYKIENSFV